MALPVLSYLYGKPEVTGDLRSTEQDFQVDEILPFEPSGDGEHLFIHLRKTGENTVFVARQLAKHFKVQENAVSYAGLKDKCAVTSQWFSVQLPGQAVNELAKFNMPNVEVLNTVKHNKKLKTGALSGNRFTITLKNVSNVEALQRRWQVICQHGVPNYFGEQRFGFGGNNINKAKQLFAGQKVRDKKKRGIYLSAARSFIFNQIVTERIDNQLFDEIQIGDVMMLSGTQSVFKVEELTDELNTRLSEQDIDLTASMWGKGELYSQGQVAAFEQAIADKEPEFAIGLAQAGLRQERRRIRLTLSEPDIKMDNDKNQVILSFTLASGCFATTILRELIDYRDLNVASKDG